MRIPEFTVRNQRSLRLASCARAPQVMIVTGPNGCGKSTLLHNLRHPAGSGPVLYVGPHRTSRRQRVRWRFLSQKHLSMREILAQDSTPGYEGIEVSSRNRDAWDYDEAGSYLKYTLCQIELDRQAAISNRFDRDGAIAAGSLPDVWKPLKELAHNLLPHLKFHKIEVTDRDSVQCLWQVHSADVTVDIDDLSSGEKAIIRLFFPLVEHRVQALLHEMRGESSEAATTPIAMLIDEPELHLHPNLQVKVLDFIRQAAVRDQMQFIIASHSPTIVDQATSDELYLLRPAELLDTEQNQLVRIASDDEKLELMRTLFGSTAHITALRPIAVVEGGKANQDAKRAMDERIYGFLSERFNQLTVFPGGSRREAIALAGRLSALLKDLSPRLRAFALVDSDTDTPEPTDGVEYLPVSMVENFLIDPKVVWAAITTVAHKTGFKNVDDVESALDDILDGLEDQEVDRRVKADVGYHCFRVTDPVVEARAQLEAFVAELETKLSDDEITRIRTAAATRINNLKEKAQRRERFNGKLVLSEFAKKHLHDTGMSKEIFIYGCAKEARARASVTGFVDALFQRLGVDAS